jgi:tetratricopeptide (TPR) repeat protein
MISDGAWRGNESRNIISYIYLMKQPEFIILILLNSISVMSQNPTINRLQNKLRTDTTDSAKCMTLDSLSMYNMFFSGKSDSTFYYCNEYISNAFAIPDKKYLALAYARISFYYNNTGRYKESLEMALKGLDLSEQYQIKDYLSPLYYDLAWVYFNLDDKASLRQCAQGNFKFTVQ